MSINYVNLEDTVVELLANKEFALAKKKLADALGLLSNKGEMTICLTENSWYITSACRRGSNIFLDGTGEK